MNKLLIGIGGKARSGKDTVAAHIAVTFADDYDIHVIHFADALYEECRNLRLDYSYNCDRCRKMGRQDEILSFSKAGRFMGNIGTPPQYISEWLLKNGCEDVEGHIRYDGMKEKDPVLLQWWGADVRRAENPNYWVDRVRERVDAIEPRAVCPFCGGALEPIGGNTEVCQGKSEHMFTRRGGKLLQLMYEGKIARDETEPPLYDIEYRPVVVLLPDTRFVNEAQYVKDAGGAVWRVARINDDGTPYISDDRDPAHPSECDLDNWKFDRFIGVASGDMDTLILIANVEFERLCTAVGERIGDHVVNDKHSGSE